jgi:hypothetical protein
VRPSILIATAISGAIVALAVVYLLKSPTTPEDQGPPPKTPTLRSPAFHLDATPDQRRAILESAFSKVASDRAERLGALKDDIALLLDDPAAVQYILNQWHLRRGEGKYADAAFADLFTLVKRPEFVDPTAELLASDFPEIRAKALQAAMTQKSPRLGPRILAIYRGAAGDPSDKKTSLRLEALHAGFACGGDALAPLLSEAFQDPSPGVAVEALTIATDADVPGTEAAARRLLETSKDRRVRVHAATVLLRRGSVSAADEIVAALDPQDQAVAAEAAHLVAKHRIEAAAGRLRELLPKTSGELKRVFALALLRLGDRATWDETIAAADAAGSEGELEALQLLGASGSADAAPILLHAIDRGGDARIRAIAAGIATSQDPGLKPVVFKLVEQPMQHPAELDDAPKVGGEDLVPRLAQLLHEATEPAAQARYLAWLSLIGGKQARDAMLRERNRIQRLVDERLRLVDLEARRLGVEAPPMTAR